MKSLIRYHPSLFVSLLIAYSQLFAPLTDDVHPFVTDHRTGDYYESQLGKTSSFQILGVCEEKEHEDERLTKKKTEPLDFILTLCNDFRFDKALILNDRLALNASSAGDSRKSAYLLYRILRL